MHALFGGHPRAPLPAFFFAVVKWAVVVRSLSPANCAVAALLAACAGQAWDALKKSINGLVNKVNVSNIQDIVLELFAENLVRGR